MNVDERTRGLAKTLRAFQERAQQAGPAASASYSLIGAIGVFGGLGYAADAWFKTAPTLLLVGLLLGVATGFYLLVTIGTRR